MTTVTYTREDRAFAHTLDEWNEQWDNASSNHREQMEEWASTATITLDDGTALTGAALFRMRQRLINRRVTQTLPLSFSKETPESRALIPGLWNWGSIPTLGGPPKVGKTTLLVDLVAALVVPGYRLLDYFEPAVLNDDDRDGDVWLINAETPPDALEAELKAVIPEEHRLRLRVWHLELQGGANYFDLTEPDLYDEWLLRFSYCNECDGTDDWGPTAVIADGMTAFLAAAGKTTSHVGLWFAQFRRLMREVGASNAIASGHNVMRGGHLMGGVEASAPGDGLWSYDQGKGGSRVFTVKPRLGGPTPPALTVTQHEGRLVAKPKGKQARAVASEPAEPVIPMRDRVLAYVQERNADGTGPSQRAVRDAVEGDNRAVDGALADLTRGGVLMTKHREGRGGGVAYWVV
jgi:hypothetical protein